MLTSRTIPDSVHTVSRASGGHDSSRRVKSELLVQVDGVNNTGTNEVVMVLAATNFPWDIDEALRRRLEKRLYIPLPNFESRKALIRINMKTVEVAPDVDMRRACPRMIFQRILLPCVTSNKPWQRSNGVFLKLILNGMRNGFTNSDQHKVYQLILRVMDCCSAWSSFRVIVLLSLIFPFEFR